ncbi:MAG TPA: ABC transporter permease [Jatrophihabitans sp.]|nr:ABC transporter permease [Jatrophihabitans sp.]
MTEWLRLALGIAILLGVTLAVLTWSGIPHRRAVSLAAVRAIVQLAFVAAVLRGVFAAPATVVAVLAVMFSVSVWTASRRLRPQADALASVALSCGLGSSLTIGLIVGLPVLSRDLRTLVAVSGIVFGGCMTAATLAGRRLHDALRRRRDEVEAWLSIGATPRQAVRAIAREAAFEAMVPGLDQTRTVGLVTLPGAFVGALLGGASATSAARFQVVVLIGLMCAQSITASMLVWRLGAPAALPADPQLAG